MRLLGCLGVKDLDTGWRLAAAPGKETDGFLGAYSSLSGIVATASGATFYRANYLAMPSCWKMPPPGIMLL
jgi:hypothetical protein